MKKFSKISFWVAAIITIQLTMTKCSKPEKLAITVFETSASGNKLTKINPAISQNPSTKIALFTDKKFQTITGFGGSFTKASASILAEISPENRQLIIDAYFADSGSRYSLTRTHINSCDFSPYNYAYAMLENDTLLQSFTIDEDLKDLLPMIKDAMKASSDGFKIIASPWTAPPWMKDNNDWKGGKLLKKYYPTWANYFSKYLFEYANQGVPLWGITVENEPLGNDNNWESMHFTPSEMNDFVINHLAPQLAKANQKVKILGFDQNRDEAMKEWVDTMYNNTRSSEIFDGTALHWYASTFDFFPEALQYAHTKAPNKHLIQTEACIDAEIPRWKNDDWYWKKEAKDWGWDWAPENQKHLHPKYVPVFRYANDIIGCLNNWVDGWIDWNMVLNKQGGPNWAKNWCIAPVIVDVPNNEVYFTPLYFTLAHFSKFIRPNAVRIGFEINNDALKVTAAQNPDGGIVLIVFNPTEAPIDFEVILNQKNIKTNIQQSALQTILINTDLNPKNN